MICYNLYDYKDYVYSWMSRHAPGEGRVTDR